MVEWKILPANTFSEIVTQWQSLNNNTVNSQLLDSVFIGTLLNYFGHEKLVVCLGYRGGDCIAAGVFEKQGIGRWQTFQPSQAPVGLWLCCTEHFDSRLIQSLATALPGVVTMIGFTQLDPRMLARPEDSPQVRTLDYITTARLTLPADFAAYWKSRGKNVRQNYNKAKNRLAKEAIEIQFDVIRDADTIAQAVCDYGQIESQGWKNQSGTAIHPENNQGKLYTQLLECYAPHDCEIWRYRYNDQIVASNLCILKDRVLIILKTTYDEAWQRYSPAFSMQIEGIQHCSAMGYRSIEFFGPTMAWHTKLTEDTRTLYHMNWYGSSALPLIKKAYSALRQKCRKTL